MSPLSNSINWYGMSDPAIVRELGSQMKKLRLVANLSQQQLAERSGLYRSTISEIENGRTASLLSFIQLLRGLGRLELFDLLLETPEVSPLNLARESGLIRKRASSLKSKDTGSGKESTW